MLLVLLERPGQLVSREELRQRLWSEQSFGELDNGLHVAASKLREALGEQASIPRFIRTIPRQGYQFIGDVAPIFEEPEVAQAELILPQIGGEIAVSGLREARSLHKTRSWLNVLAAAFIAVTAATAILIYLYGYGHRPIATGQDKLVVGGFANLTGNHAYDGTLVLPFRVKFEESPYLSLVSDLQFRRLIKAPDIATVQEQLHACVQLGAQILLQGQISVNDQTYIVQLIARRCSDGRQLTSQVVETSVHTDVLTALNLATEKMRGRLGEPESSLKKFNVPLIQATTGSLAALRAYNQGEEKHINGNESESMADYKLAIDLDPQFALAYARLGTSYSNSGEFSLSHQYYQKAFELRERTTDREKLYIASGYYSYATGEIQRGIQAYQLWSSLYPHDIIPANNLATQYIILGEPEKAVGLARTAIRLDPTVNLPYSVLGQAYLRTGDYADLDQLCNDPVHGNTVSIGLHVYCFQSAFIQNDEAAMQRQLKLAEGSPQESALLSTEAEVAMYRGKLEESRRLFSKAEQNAIRNNLAEFAAGIDVNKASLEADIGLSQLAQQDLSNGLQLTPDSAQIEAAAAYVFARIGNFSKAESESNKAFAQSPKNTILNSAMLAVVRAEVQIQRHNSEAARQALEETRPYDFNAFMGMAPIYYRGLAYMDGEHWKEAAGEFQRIVDHRTMSPSSLYVTLAQLELGRAQQLTGDKASAARTYQQVAAVWNNADPSYPPLRQLHSYQHELGR